jgi:hypothetical protein
MSASSKLWRSDEDLQRKRPDAKAPDDLLRTTRDLLHLSENDGSDDTGSIALAWSASGARPAGAWYFGRGGDLVGLGGLCSAAAGSRLETRLLGCGRAGQSVVVVGAGPGVLLRVFVRPRACFRAFA